MLARPSSHEWGIETVCYVTLVKFSCAILAYNNRNYKSYFIVTIVIDGGVFALNKAHFTLPSVFCQHT